MTQKKKHIPKRTCVSCRGSDAKRSLLRVVRQPDGTVCYDERGKISGRGAYLCSSEACIALAKKQKRLERSFKVENIPDSLFQTLLDLAQAAEAEDKSAENVAKSSENAQSNEDNQDQPESIRDATGCGTKPRERESEPHEAE